MQLAKFSTDLAKNESTESSTPRTRPLPPTGPWLPPIRAIRGAPGPRLRPRARPGRSRGSGHLAGTPHAGTTGTCTADNSVSRELGEKSEECPTLSAAASPGSGSVIAGAAHPVAHAPPLGVVSQWEPTGECKPKSLASLRPAAPVPMQTLLLVLVAARLVGAGAVCTCPVGLAVCSVGDLVPAVCVDEDATMEAADGGNGYTCAVI